MTMLAIASGMVCAVLLLVVAQDNIRLRGRVEELEARMHQDRHEAWKRRALR